MDSKFRNLIGRRIRLTNTDHPNLNYGDLGTIVDIDMISGVHPAIWVDWDKGPTRALVPPRDMFDFVD